jgi:hypothetical protein
LKQVEADPYLRDKATPKYREVGRSNVMVGGMLIMQQRTHPTACARGNHSNKKLTWQTCTGSREDTDPFGVDPAFFSSSSVYDASATMENYYDTSVGSNEVESNTQGTNAEKSIPLGFHHTDTPMWKGKPTINRSLHSYTEKGFPVFLDMNLGRHGVKRFINVMKDGFFIDYQTTEVRVITCNNMY